MERLKCIRCPLGCIVRVRVTKSGIEVEGNRCPRGEEFALQEIENPMRILTTSVKVSGGSLPLVSVKTSGAVPKDKIKELMEYIKSLEVKAPVRIGDVLEENVMNLGVDLVATRNCDEK